MQKMLHIIPAWEDTVDLEPYVKLASLAKEKGYKVVPHNVDWTRPLSEQVFPVG